MPTWVYPTSQELITIEQDKLPRLTDERAGLRLFPFRDQDAYMLSFEQKDNYQGLQQIRGLNGEPARVKHIGAKRYDILPGIYGEFKMIDEHALTTRRQFGTYNQPIDITDLVGEAQDHLLQRRLDRVELIIWTLLITGTFSVALPYGTGVMHTDSFSVQTFTAAVSWGTLATATPLADLRAIKLLSRGHSVQFNAGSTLYVNQATANNLENNQNSNDLFGRRQAGLSTINSLADINKLIAGDDLPQIAVYDEGYYDDTGTFQLFIPANKGVLIGRRTNGALLGEYIYTRNVNNPDMGPGAYTKVFDRVEREVPRTIEVHDGHNGGPALYYPGAIISMNL